MPKVKGNKIPYTAKGKAAAKKWLKKPAQRLKKSRAIDG